MFLNRRKRQRTRIDTLLGAGTTIEGDVRFSGGLRIDGAVKGSIRSGDDGPSTLVISEQGRIEGQVHVAHLVVNGTIVGPVDVTDLLELQANARVTGDVSYNKIEMHPGAVVYGKLTYKSSSTRAVGLKLASSKVASSN